MVHQVDLFIRKEEKKFCEYLGTGKSRTIAGIVRNLLKTLGKKRKILLCAPSNNACDELCRRILDEFARHRMDCEPGKSMRSTIGHLM